MGDTGRVQLPDPALVVLVGASGSGKSTWAAAHYREQEVVSSDALRGVVGSGPHDLDASADAFGVLETIVAARLGRGLTTVVDTLGLDAARRQAWLAAARAAGLPAVAVLLDTPDAECRRRNAARDRPVPAPALAGQLRSARDVRAVLEAEGWDLVVASTRDAAPVEAAPEARRRHAATDRTSSLGLRAVLQVSRFPWGEDPLAWLTGIARAADEAGFAGLALMDHLIQVPQVGRAWEPIPEPWVTLGAIAALGTDLELGTLCTPVTFRPAGVTAKAAATLSALTGGRAFVGIGAGWFEREHAAYGIAFPPARERLDDLERAIVTMKALWASGHQGVRRARGRAAGDHLLPATGRADPGGRRRLGRAPHPADRRAHGDACNLRTTDEAELARLIGVLHAPLRRRRPRPVRGRGHRARPAGGRPRPRRRVGAGRAAPRPHPGSDVRRPHARRDRRRSPRPLGPPRGAGREHRLPRHARPRRPRRRPRPSGSERLSTSGP